MEIVDILMATYNGEEYVEEQINSILNQTYKNFRLIISDDGSKDKTRDILKEYEKKDDRIKVFFQEKNLGVIKNFEFLLKNVKNKYFMFSDQDDVWNIDKIQLSMKNMEETNADLVYTDLEVVDEKLNTIADSYWKLKGLYKKIIKYNDFEALYLNNFITGCTILVKSEWIDKILPLPNDSKYVLHDYWISLIISQTGKLSYLNKTTLKYRQHFGNSVGSETKSEKMKTLDEIRELFIDVKIQHFKVFIENEDKFVSEKIKKLNKISLKYYESLNKVKYLKFSKLILFFKLYKYENFKYTIKNLIILQFPGIGRLIFKFIKEKK